MTSLEVFNEGKGVCRDYAHLAIGKRFGYHQGIGLRMMKLMRGGKGARREAELGQRFFGSNHIRRPRRACRTKCG